jgi:hypothetical protein
MNPMSIPNWNKCVDGMLAQNARDVSRELYYIEPNDLTPDQRKFVFEKIQDFANAQEDVGERSLLKRAAQRFQ